MSLYDSLRKKIEPELNFTVTEDEIRSEALRIWEVTKSPPDDCWSEAEKSLWEKKRATAAQKIMRIVANASQECVATVQEKARIFSGEIHARGEKKIRLLPDGVRFHQTSDTQEVVIFEEPPTTRTILVNMVFHDKGIGSTRNPPPGTPPNHTSVRIALPYVVHYMEFTGGVIVHHRLYFRNSPIQSLSDSLGLPWLPNVYENGRTCCPFSKKTDRPLAEAIRTVVGEFWQSEFLYNLHQYNPGFELKFWETWEKATKSDPLFILKFGWWHMGSVQSILKELWNSKVQISAEIQVSLNNFLKEVTHCLKVQEPASE